MQNWSHIIINYLNITIKKKRKHENSQSLISNMQNIFKQIIKQYVSFYKCPHTRARARAHTHTHTHTHTHKIHNPLR